PSELAGSRTDKVLAQLFPQYSRTVIQGWLRQGLVLVDDETPRPRDPVTGGERVDIAVPQAPEPEWQAQPVPLDIVHADPHLLVINKSAGLVVHPGAGNPDQTLLNGLLHYDPRLAELPRAGLVHRLDRDTSGLLVVARTETVRRNLLEQLAARSVTREYLTVVCGKVISGGTVDEPIGRDPHDRRRMRVTQRGRDSVTHYRVAERFRAHTLLRVNLDTGRTHQIRVHLKHVGFPVFGDPVYGERLRIPAQAAEWFARILRGFRRQALHATRLSLIHPHDGKECSWQSRLPDDMQALVTALSADQRAHRAEVE
ncbi:MAG: 23S rRNA pseudouridine(1911/1915/1917) synthase RluD, partial [Gammaproteobacteria bacterium]|nr:23S rRNA pseudouridine(1911/1915/1917) synthase RluD [Gammaproteobacteria bacterium]